MTPLYGGIEGGGTKFVVGVGTPAGGSIATARIATGDPVSTIKAVAGFFGDHAGKGPLGGIGLASFGPLCLDPALPAYGHLLATPKSGWAGFDLLSAVADRVGRPVALETDVNAAALAEAVLGAGRGRGDLAYVTVGTGIGVGLIVDGKPLHGAAHPEAGHILPRRHPAHGNFAGICPFHGDCLEGLASGGAIEAAWGASLDRLPPDHPAWEVEADYLGQLCATLILTTAPATIVLGGGVMSQTRLFDSIRCRTASLLAGYAQGGDTGALATRIVPPACAEPPGLLGAYLLAERLGTERP